MNIIIPLGGKGERFRAKYSEPKPLIPVFNKAIIFHVLDNLYLNKDDKVFIIYYSILDKYSFANKINEQYPHVKCLPIYKQTVGAAETISLGLDRIMEMSKNRRCVLLDCDTYYTENILEKVRQYDEKNIIFYRKKYETDIPKFSYIELNEGSEVLKIREKEKISSNANTGCYVFNDIMELKMGCNAVLHNQENMNGEVYTSKVIDHMLEDNTFIGIELMDEYVFSLGTPKELDEYMKKSSIYLFDMDGTIVNTDGIYFKVWHQILKEYNVELDKSIFDKYIQGQNDTTVLKYFVSNVDETILTNISKIKDELFMKYVEEIEIIDGIIEFMSRIRMSGNHISIVTNSNRATAEHIINVCGFSKYVDRIIIGNECTRPKPYPDPYLKAIEEYGGAKTMAKVYIFEDSMSGLLSARQIKTDCIIGITSVYDKETLIKNGANLAIEQYSVGLLERIMEYNKENEMDSLKENIRWALSLEKNVEVRINNNKLKGGFISDVIEVEIEGNRYVSKMVNKNETNLSIMAKKLGLYERENYFYEVISKYVNVNYPKYYGLIRNREMETIGIMLENMNQYENMRLNLDLNKEDVNVGLKVLDEMAKMHAKFWNRDLKTAFPELKKHNDAMFCPVWKNFIEEKWEIFNKVWNKVLTVRQMERMYEIKNEFDMIQNEISEGDLTLVHGDLKSPNIYYDVSDQYRPCFLDWQYIAIGKGAQDMIFFLIESFSVENIKLYYPIFKNYYYMQLNKYGVVGYEYEKYEKDILNSAKYFPYFVAIWFGTVPDDDLIDKNFPFFFIKKLVWFYEMILE